MSVRSTSIQAYREIQSNGLLSKRRFEVYDCLFHHGPLSSMEIKNRISSAALNSTSPRLAELRNMGVVAETGTKRCQHTGQTVILWDVTGNLPVALPKKKSLKQELKELREKVRHLEAHNKRLRILLDRATAE